jgi:UDP-hydrolysing UDP-N-acetyl-D-glucosamine 2-epimerase
MTTSRRRIAVVTGSRADYGLLRGLLARLRECAGIDLEVVACGMHLAPRFGETWRAIEADGFTLSAKVDFELGDDTPQAIARSTGIGTIGFSAAFQRLAPDLIVVLGDRFEILSAATAATLSNIPIAHIHGGEITAGAFDDAIRHAVTKMACIHFVAAEPYRLRVIQMGENPDFVLNVGAPGLDQVNVAPVLDRSSLFESLGIGEPRRFLLVTLHPTTARPGVDLQSVTSLLGALAEIKDRSIIFTGVNADPGNRVIDNAVRDFVSARPGQAHLFTSLGSDRYWSTLRLADVVIGNSSSGILEAPAVGTPSINIGDRQSGRLRAASIIDCAVDQAHISAALNLVLEGRFQPDLSMEPPYGRGGASNRITDILQTIDLTKAFPKSFYDLPSSAIPRP